MSSALLALRALAIFLRVEVQTSKIAHPPAALLEEYTASHSLVAIPRWSKSPLHKHEDSGRFIDTGFIMESVIAHESARKPLVNLEKSYETTQSKLWSCRRRDRRRRHHRAQSPDLAAGLRPGPRRQLDRRHVDKPCYFSDPNPPPRTPV
jgi:hypothetical protein